MKERPILFSGPMVRAILDGRKTQTRRMVKWPASYKDHEIADAVRALNRSSTKSIGRHGPCDGIRDRFRCPYGVVGDRLWVRETFADARAMWGKVFYRADDQTDHDSDGTWTPSIHMPRWASRITLEIVSIRVERLQEITEEDAKAEGVERGIWSQPAGLFMEPCDETDDKHATYRDGFGFLWSSIYGNWDSNSYVWVVEFRRVDK